MSCQWPRNGAYSPPFFIASSVSQVNPAGLPKCIKAVQDTQRVLNSMFETFELPSASLQGMNNLFEMRKIVSDMQKLGISFPDLSSSGEEGKRLLSKVEPIDLSCLNSLNNIPPIITISNERGETFQASVD